MRVLQTVCSILHSFSFGEAKSERCGFKEGGSVTSAHSSSSAIAPIRLHCLCKGPRAKHSLLVKGCEPIICWAVSQYSICSKKWCWKVIKHYSSFCTRVLAEGERTGLLLKKVSRTIISIICSDLTLCKELRHSL